LNGLTTQVQYFQVGTSGTDFAISSSTATHTFNLPTASAANRGALSSADWTTFNNKQSTLSLTTTGNSGSATLVSNTLNVPTYTLAGLGGISLTSLSATTPLSYNNTTGAFSIQVANTSQDGYLSSTDWNTFNSKQSTITNPVTGTGTSGQVTYFNGTSSVTSSSNFKFDGTNLTIGNPSSALAQLHIYNASAAATILLQTNSTTDYSEIAVRNNSSTATSYFRQYSTAATGSDFGVSRAGLALFFSNYATNFAIGTRNGGDLILGTADTERARITSTGIFGIGTASPSGILDVQKNQNATTNVYFRNTDNTNSSSRMYLNIIAGNSSAGFAVLAGGSGTGDFYIGGNNGGNTYFQPYLGGGVTMTLTNGGNVGIGTSSPTNFTGVGFTGPFLDIAGILQIKGTSANTLAAFQLGGDTYRKALIYTPVGTDTPYLAFGVATSGSSSSANEAMRITSGGDKIMKGSVSDITFTGDGVQMNFGRNDANYIQANGGTSSNIRVISNTNGVVLSNGATSWGAISDENTKDIIEPINNACLKLKDLRTVIGKYKTDEKDSRRLFLIAQDVEKVFPEAVFDMKNEDETTNLGLNYQDLIPVLVKAIQELSAEIDELKNK
jgi:hypothetical protein